MSVAAGGWRPQGRIVKPQLGVGVYADSCAPESGGGCVRALVHFEPGAPAAGMPALGLLPPLGRRRLRSWGLQVKEGSRTRLACSQG